MATPHDALFRKVFSDPRYGRELIEFALPESLSREMRHDTLTLRSTDFLTDALAERRADLLFEVETSSGPAAVYVLLEHKSRADPDTVLQIHDYIVQIWKRARAAREPLRIVYPIVVHHGGREWKASRSMHEHLGLEQSTQAIRDCTPEYRYFLLELREEQILAAQRLSAFVKLVTAILAGPRTRAELGARLARAAGLLPLAGQEDGDVALVYTYVFEVGKFRAADVVELLRPSLPPRHLRQIMNDMEILTRHLRSKFKREGLVEGKRELVTAQAERRFGTLPDHVRAHIASADADTLDRIAMRILDAESPDDLLDKTDT